MRRAAAMAICSALAVCAAAPALASFRIRLPRSLRFFARRSAAAPAIPAFPEGSLVSAYAIPGGDASFALYLCGLQPDEALAAASGALAAAGWSQVSVFGNIALFENSSGNCAAVQAIPAQGGASAVSIIAGGRP